MDLFKLFPDDATVAQWFAAQRWPDGKSICPACGHHDVQVGAAHANQPYRCRNADCRKRFSVKTGTAMQSSKLGCQTWAIAMYLVVTSLKGISSMKLHRELDVTQKSAWHLAHRIRQAWGTDLSEVFAGPAEVDEAYFGGLEKNKHASKKLRAGRGTVGKTAVAGVKDRETNRISAAVVESTQRRELQRFVAERVAVEAAHYTDESSSYLGLPNHESVNHRAGEYVKGDAHVQGMESFWSMMKRGVYGTYHRLSEKHLDRYVNEFAGRHNIRSEDTIDQLREVARGMLDGQLRYRDLTADNGRSPYAKEIR